MRGLEISASHSTHAPSLVLAAVGNSGHFIALDDVLWGVLQQMPSVPFLVCVCVCEHPHQALPHGPVHVSARLHGGADARALPAAHGVVSEGRELRSVG